MRFALFSGCKIPYYLEHYGASTVAVLEALGVELIEIEFSCCGYPSRNTHFEAYILSAARNLALARNEGLNILTPCKCCFGSLKHAIHWLKEYPDLRRRVNKWLGDEGLRWEEGVEVKHLLTVLDRDVGQEKIKALVRTPFRDLRIAAHYGCHALRPSSVVDFDDPLSPTLFERLIKVTGAEAVDWERRLECCGNPLWEKNNELSLDLMSRKIEDAKGAGAAFLCTACTYCQMQFDGVQEQEIIKMGKGEGLPAILYPQLLG
jgi:heterodisulfide reductase subunit B